MRFLLFFIGIFLHALEASASLGIQNELCEGVHQYRIKFSRNISGTDEEGALTLLGCHHFMRLETLSKVQQDILRIEAARSTEVYNERTDEYLNTRLRAYVDILQNIAANPTGLDSNFFAEYARIISNETNHSPVHPHVSEYFSRILNQKLHQGFLDLLDINLNETALEAIRALAQPEKVERLPLRLVYDFTASYVKRTSLEYQIIDQYRSATGNPRVCALDGASEMNDGEEALFNGAVDFSPISSASVRAEVLSFYGDLGWMFNETQIYSVIPKALAQQVQVLCSISEEMKQRINEGVLTRILQEDLSIQNCSALTRMKLKSSINNYLEGEIVIGTSADNVVERNYDWLKGALLNAISETQNLVIFGDAHLMAAGNNRGVLQFFMDHLSEKESDFWSVTLGFESWHAWQKITIKSVERLTKNGIYLSVFEGK